MSRKFKTKKSKRTNYIYYQAEGPQIILTPGKDGVTEADITMLHTLDDEDYDKERRNNYRTTYITSYFPGEEDDDQEDRNKYLIDHNSDINKIIENKCDEENHQFNLKRLKKAMQGLLPEQKDLLYKIYIEGRSNTYIAKEENITEAAVRNRLKKIYKKLLKKF
jgi:RNA polymerase sigma factor (sigma-70 family)